MGQFQEWSPKLKLEGAKHKLWLTEVEAFDSKRDSNLQRFRNNLALKRMRQRQSCAMPIIAVLDSTRSIRP